MRVPLLALAVLLCAMSARAQEKTDKLVFSQRVDCRGTDAASEAGIPKNSVLLAFDSKNLAAAEDWIVKDKPAMIRAVNQLLSVYGIDSVRAREFPMDAANKIFASGMGDVQLDYSANSFLVRVTNECPTQGNTNSYPVCMASECGTNNEVYGPELRHYAADSCVQGISYMPDEVPKSQRVPRLRAYLAAIIVHEVIHAAHARVLGDLLAGEPSKPPKACAAELDLATAISVTRKMRSEMGIACGAMHMSDGLMVAGISFHGDPCDAAGGGTPNLGQCVSDTKVPAGLFEDLGVFARSGFACTEKKVPIRDFFAVPAKNLALINRHLGKAAAAGCHSACYYRVVKAKASR